MINRFHNWLMPDTEVSFENDILPILTAKCALLECHFADGPHGLDFRTYESINHQDAHDEDPDVEHQDDGNAH